MLHLGLPLVPSGGADRRLQETEGLGCPGSPLNQAHGQHGLWWWVLAGLRALCRLPPSDDCEVPLLGAAQDFRQGLFVCAGGQGGMGTGQALKGWALGTNPWGGPPSCGQCPEGCEPGSQAPFPVPDSFLPLAPNSWMWAMDRPV